MTNRVSFLIDGFNLYHSICDAIRDHQLPAGKWLNMLALCQSYCYLFGKDAVVHDIYYFSALATHTDDFQAPIRHQTLMAALESTSIKVVLGKFKRKLIKCRAGCGRSGWGYEEKETDVNIAITLLELFLADSCDTAVIVSGDTDLATAIRAAKRLFPHKMIGVGFPYRRANKELRQLADFSFRIGPRHYQQFVFPNQIVLPSGKIISKPSSW